MHHETPPSDIFLYVYIPATPGYGRHYPPIQMLISSKKPTELMPKLFGPLRERYLERPGGYTRVLRIEPHKDDQAPSAILELVDGPRDMRFAITAKAMLKERDSDTGLRDYTLRNIRKVTRYRANGEQELEDMADRLARMEISEERRQKGILKRKVYPDRRMQLNPGSKDGDED